MVLELKELLKRNYRLISGLRGEFVSNPKIPTELLELSYFAQSCLISVGNIELQSLLEEGSIKNRLLKSIQLLEKNELLLKDLVSNKFNSRDSVTN